MHLLRLLFGTLLLATLSAQTPTDREEFFRHVDKYTLPEYPQKCIDDQRAGTVAASVQVDQYGGVASVTITTSSDPRMSAAVKAAISGWTFRPFTEVGKPHEANGTVFIHFRLVPGGPHVLIPGLIQ